MGMLEDLFPGLPPTPGDIIDDVGGFLDGVGDFLFGDGPSDQSIAVAGLVRTMLNGRGAESMYEAQRATRRQVDTQRELAGQAHELVGRLESAWTGPSSSGARDTIRSFADVADESSTVLDANARNIERQVEGYERTRNSLEPMPDPPPTKGAFDPDFSGAKKRRIRRYEQQAERNRQRYTGFVDETNANVADLNPEYGPMPEERGTGGRDYRPATPGVGWGGRGGIEVPGVGTPGGVVPGQGGVGALPDDVQVGTAGPGGYHSSTTAAASGSGAGTGAGGSGAGGFAGGGLPGGSGIAAGAGQDALALGGQSGAAQPGAGSGTGAGARAGTGAAGGGAGAARGGASGARGGGMMGGVPAGGGGKGQGSDDEEHRRKSVLQENDPEGLFGSDELTAPPVIGDDDYE